MNTVKKQDIAAEIDFFNKVSAENKHFDTISEELYHFIIDSISPYLQGKILEAGCGSGAFGERIKNKIQNCKIVGVDLNEKLIGQAKNGTYSSLICANLEEEDIFEKDTFDTVVCPYLLHHFPDMDQVAHNLLKWLKPNGFLIIVDPNGSNLVLRFSYLLRKLLTHLVNIEKYASINESHKSVKEYKKSFKAKLINVKTFRHKPRKNPSIWSLRLVFVLIFFQKLLLNIYSSLPFVKYKHSDLIIIFQKNEV